MIWKIIFFLPCFTVSVNAGQCIGPMSSSQSQYPAPYPVHKSREWVESLQETSDINWRLLTLRPGKDEKIPIKVALRRSKCPTDLVKRLLDLSNWSKWPTELKSGQSPYYNLSNMGKLKCRKIPGANAVIAAPFENQGLPVTGGLFIFSRLVSVMDAD